MTKPEKKLVSELMELVMMASLWTHSKRGIALMKAMFNPCRVWRENFTRNRAVSLTESQTLVTLLYSMYTYVFQCMLCAQGAVCMVCVLFKKACILGLNVFLN